CHQAGSDAKLTDGGRKVYGGDGITPDYCVEPTAPSKFMAYLQARQAFIGFSRSYSASETSGVADIAGTGRRSGVTSGKVKLISKDFQVDEKVLADFNAYLDSRKLKHTPEDLAANHEAISRLILEEILRQVYGEGEARRRTLAWDPQVQKALSLVPKAEELLKEPQRFIAEYEAEEKAAASRPQ
ncbi:MAG: hypothetical protein DMF83_30000, partial [Acidobacteria bacterium]